MNEAPTEGPIVTGQQPGALFPPPAPQPTTSHLGRTIAFIVAGVVVVAGAAAAGYMYMQKQKEAKIPVKVGIMLPFSGPGSAAGFGSNRGILLAKKQLGTTNMEFIQEDSKCDPDAAVAAMKRLIAKKVVAVIGESCSGASTAALKIANENKIVMISPSATSASLSIPDDYFFRVVPPDTFQGKFAAKIMYDKGIRTAATIFSDEPYGKSLDETFQASFKALGGTIVSMNAYEANSLDLSEQVNATIAAKPQGIYLLGISGAAGVDALKRLHDQGSTAPIYTSEALTNNTMLDSAGVAAEGLTATIFSAGSQAYTQAFINEYGSLQQNYAAAPAYDAVQALYLVIKDGARTTEEIRAKLSKLDFTGVSGHIVFDKNGEISNADYKYQVIQVKDGDFEVVE